MFGSCLGGSLVEKFQESGSEERRSFGRVPLVRQLLLVTFPFILGCSRFEAAEYL
jgi:hypothetical protein